MMRKPSNRWIKCGLPFHAYEKDCFTSRYKEAKVGTLIEVETENGPKQYLIGDINTVGGECDDCPAFPNETVVIRYKVVWVK